MAVADYLYRAIKGEPLPWPLSEELLEEEVVQRVLNKVTSEEFAGVTQSVKEKGIRGLLEWLAEQLGGLWWRLANAVDLAVATVIYNFMAAGDTIKVIAQPSSLQVAIKPSQVTLRASESISFKVKVNTKEGQPLSTSQIRWEVTGGGTVDQNGFFTAAENAFGSYAVKVRIPSVDPNGELRWVIAEAHVTIAQVENRSPVIKTLTADPSPVQPDGWSRISVFAYDPDGDPLTYTWSATGGRLSSTTGPEDKIWIAPSTPGTYQITVRVTDNKPGHAPVSRSVEITVVTHLSFDFSLSATPRSGTVTQDNSIVTTVRAWRTVGPTTQVGFTITGLPTGVTATPSSWSWDLGDQSRTVTFFVSPTAPVGTYTITIVGTGGGVTKDVAFTLTVTSPSPSFDISFTPSSLTVTPGASGTTTLTITPKNDFAGIVRLSLENAPTGITLSPTSITVSGTNTIRQELTISVGTGAAPGTYNLRVRATLDNITKTANLTLSVTQRPGVIWTERSSDTASNLNGVAYGNGIFVAVGEYGTILTSKNGATWTVRTSGIEETLHSVTYGGGTFVVVGERGTVLTSRDGINWAKRTSGISWDLNDVTYGDGIFVAVGDLGTILISRDGEKWGVKTLGTVIGYNLRGVTYGDGVFVAVGDVGPILTSRDGIAWTERMSPAAFLEDVAYGNGTFVAVGVGGTILTSKDGIKWTVRSGANSLLAAILNFFDVTYGDGTFVAVGFGGIPCTSTDGSSWTPQTSGKDWYNPYNLFGVTYGNGIFVAVGSSGTILTSP